MVESVFRARQPTEGYPRAMTFCARMLGLTERRVRSFIEREVKRISADEWLQIRARYREFLARESKRLEHEAALLRLRGAKMDAEDIREGLFP